MRAGVLAFDGSAGRTYLGGCRADDGGDRERIRQEVAPERSGERG